MMNIRNHENKKLKHEINQNLEFAIIVVGIIFLILFVINYIIIYHIGTLEDLNFFSIIANLKFETNDIIIAFLPTTVTIISIIFSINDNKIYGISINSFRKMRSNDYFSFADMLYFIIFVYCIYGFAKGFGLKICLYYIDIVVLISSLLFIKQDVPLIEKNEAAIDLMFKNIFDNNSKDGILKESSKQKELEKLIEIVLYSKGFKETYLLLKTSDLNVNTNILFTLLGIIDKSINNFLEYEYSNSINLDFTLSRKAEDEINSTFEILNNLFNYKFDINIEGHEENKEYSLYFVISNIIITLNYFNKFFNKSEFQKIIYSKMSNLLSLIIKNSNYNDDFKTKIISELIIYSFNNSKINFLEMLINLIKENYENNDFYDFLICYLAMFIYYENNNIKNKQFYENLNNLINESTISDIIALNWSNRKEITKNIFDSIFCSNISSLIEKIIKVYKNNQKSNNLKFYRSIFQNYIELIISKYYDSKFDSKNINQIINSLDFIDKVFVATILNDDWFDDENNFVNYLDKTNGSNVTFISFFNIKINSDSSKYGQLIFYLKNFKNEYLLLYYKNHFINDEDIAKFNKSFKENFKIEKFINKNENLIKQTDKILSYNKCFNIFGNNEYNLKILQNNIYMEIQAFVNSPVNIAYSNFMVYDLSKIIRKLNDDEINEVLNELDNLKIDDSYKFNKFNDNIRIYINEKEMRELIKGFYIHVEYKILCFSVKK